MQMFTELPLQESEQPARSDNPACNQTGAGQGNRSAERAKRPTDAIWPDYFARRGQADATTWHYRGHAADCLNVWRAYYGFMLSHPWIALRGLRQFFHSLIYRVLGATVGDRSGLLVTLATPLLLVTAPPAALAGVCIASVPSLKRRMPPMFQPFTLMGWTNYCIMLALVFTLHGYRQQRRRLHPAQAMLHSSKLFWNEFFARALPQGQYPTHICAKYQGGMRQGQLPCSDIVIKPVSGGAGHHLRSLRWDAARDHYWNQDSERQAGEPEHFKQAQLDIYLRDKSVPMLVERLERPRAPLPIGTLRILTLCTGNQADLLCAAFLPAPAGSVSTAYFDLDTYLVDYQHSTIGEPLNNRSDGKLRGIPLPELPAVIDTCLRLHEQLREHVQISWDILPAVHGPVFLEGNVFPPGCDYKLTLFKNPANFRYLRDRIIASSREAE